MYIYIYIYISFIYLYVQETQAIDHFLLISSLYIKRKMTNVLIMC